MVLATVFGSCLSQSRRGRLPVARLSLQCDRGLIVEENLGSETSGGFPEVTQQGQDWSSTCLTPKPRLSSCPFIL